MDWCDLDGSGERCTGESKPLLSLGADSMVQAFIKLNHYIIDGENKELKELYIEYLDEMVDHDLTGEADPKSQLYRNVRTNKGLQCKSCER